MLYVAVVLHVANAQTVLSLPRSRIVGLEERGRVANDEIPG